MIHRSGKQTEQSRFRKKYIDRYEWQNNKSQDTKIRSQMKRSKGKRSNQKINPEYKSVLFVSRTPGGELCSRIKQAEASLGSRLPVKVVERGGAKLRDLLHK